MEQNKKFERKPIHEFKAALSEDQRFWIFKNIETWIIPVGYLDAISESKKTPKPVDKQVSGKTA